MTLSNSSETIIFGGSFNPPTVSHQAMAEACLALPGVEEVWFLPSGDRLDKTISVDAEHRLNMLSEMIGEMALAGKLGISTIDVDMPPPTQTIKTIQTLEEQFPDRRFRYLFGADSFETMHTWKDGKYIRDELPLLIVPRGDLSLNYGENVRLLGRVPIETSSTDVRGLVKEKKDIGKLVAKGVANYVAANQLYV